MTDRKRKIDKHLFELVLAQKGRMKVVKLELQGKQKLNRAIPVCKFIRVLKNDSKRLQGDELLDLWLVRSRKEEQCYF